MKEEAPRGCWVALLGGLGGIRTADPTDDPTLSSPAQTPGVLVKANTVSTSGALTLRAVGSRGGYVRTEVRPHAPGIRGFPTRGPPGPHASGVASPLTRPLSVRRRADRGGVRREREGGPWRRGGAGGRRGHSEAGSGAWRPGPRPSGGRHRPPGPVTPVGARESRVPTRPTAATWLRSGTCAPGCSARARNTCCASAPSWLRGRAPRSWPSWRRWSPRRCASTAGARLRPARAPRARSPAWPRACGPCPLSAWAARAGATLRRGGSGRRKVGGAGRGSPVGVGLAGAGGLAQSGVTGELVLGGVWRASFLCGVSVHTPARDSGVGLQKLPRGQPPSGGFPLERELCAGAHLDGQLPGPQAY